MKKTRILAAALTAAITASAMTAAASAYDLDNFDLGIGWSASITVPGSEFADLTADSYVTVTFETDPYENEYWCLKPLIDDGGWQFIADYAADGEDVVAALSEDNGTFAVKSDMTSVTFKIPAAAIGTVKDSGLILMGHSLILHELTISNEAPAGAGSDSSNDSSDDSSSPAADDKGNADTGVEGVAAVAGIALLASAAVVVSRKRK